MSPLSCLSSLSPSFLSPLLSYKPTMLSTLSASNFTALDVDLTPWDFDDVLSAFEIPTSPKLTSSSGSGEPNEIRLEVEKPGFDDSNRNMEERKRKRMISNRESARRSRMRKQRHLENLRNQLNLFKVKNRELKTGLQFLLCHLNRLRTENEWLRSERTVLRQKLSNISQILVFQPFSTAWPCNIATAE
uniref:BZIP transcription factor RISBZ3-like n=1 Tax=Cicer arietinum TaxID=3827 RepID=A0A1S2YY64_CICAR|nr:bZIP transcription factor RISBZ3-like [Cicer arietinum]